MYLCLCVCRKPARSRRRNVAQELQDEYDRLSTSIQEFRGVQLAGRLSGFTQLLRARPDLMRPMSRAIKAVDDTSKRLLEVVSLGAGAAVTAEVNELNKVRALACSGGPPGDGLSRDCWRGGCVSVYVRRILGELCGVSRGCWWRL